MRGILFSVVLCIVAVIFIVYLPTMTSANAVTAQIKFNGEDAPVSNLKSISGLESEVEIIEYKNGDDPITHKRAGKSKYKNITLKRRLSTASSNNSEFMSWHKRVLAGSTDRKSGSIIYLDREGNEVMRYNFFEGWPSRISQIPEDKTHVLEEIELAIESLQRA